MADEGGLEKKVAANAPKGGGSVFDAIGGSIDSLIDSIKAVPGAIKDAAHYTYYSVKAAAGVTLGYLAAGIGALITAGGFVAGKYLSNSMSKTKTTYKDVANELMFGGLLGGFLGYLFKVSAMFGNAAKAAYGAATGYAAKAGSALVSIPLFMTNEEYTRRLLDRGYKAKSLKEQWESIKKVILYLGAPIAANFAFLSGIRNYVAAAIITTAYSAIKSVSKKEEKKEATPQYQLPPGYALPQAA